MNLLSGIVVLEGFEPTQQAGHVSAGLFRFGNGAVDVGQGRAGLHHMDAAKDIEDVPFVSHGQVVRKFPTICKAIIP
ncbi:hypothetical protein MOK15_00510 [Sphingobium sp. BYY-5]|uniref:hypothetical protein n=1 Tax=Sphingobium sp. BYY-5 TaxID=2926400 RepID=UPI001FA784AA|nr:hypothetical protein [Sphingobium sp. BYY-5]MCI4588590.1 hypothetical protein [Sphingobium sp. BYY-5]